MLVRIFLLLLVFMLTSSEISQDGTFLYHKVGFRKIENQHLVKYKPVQYTLKLRIWTIMKKVYHGGTLCFAFYVPRAVIETFVELYCLALSVSLQWYQGP